MKFLSIVFLMLLLPLQLAGQSFAPTVIRVEASPELNPGVIRAYIPVTFDIYIEQAGTMPLWSLIASLELNGENGLTEISLMIPDSGSVYLDEIALMNGFGGDEIWDMVNEVNGRSWDGQLPDSLFHGGAAIGPGWLPYEGEKLYYSFTCLFHDPGTFTLDYFDPCCLDGYVIDYENMLPFEFCSWSVEDFVICGDVDGNGSVNLLDVTYFIEILYTYPIIPMPIPLELGDVSNDGVINILDMTYLINYLYKAGPEPECPDPAGPSGSLIDYLGCKEFPEGRGTPTDSSCVYYHYDIAGNLFLKHINAGFNCCPDSLDADIIFEDNMITIEEIEFGGLCDCNCLFDLDLEIIDLPPGVYTVYFHEPYRNPEDPVLEFELDLSVPTSGIHCVPRQHYPWGPWW